jgi:hypothetical protein
MGNLGRKDNRFNTLLSMFIHLRHALKPLREVRFQVWLLMVYKPNVLNV